MFEHTAPSFRRQAVWLLALQAMATGDVAVTGSWLRALGEAERTSIVPLFPVVVTDEVRLVRMAIATGDEELAESAVATSERRVAANPGVRTIAATAAHARGLLTGDDEYLARAVELFDHGLRPLALASALEDRGAGALKRPPRAGGRRAQPRADALHPGRSRVGCASRPEPVARAGRAPAVGRPRAAGYGLGGDDRLGARRRPAGGAGPHQSRGRGAAVPRHPTPSAAICAGPSRSSTSTHGSTSRASRPSSTREEVRRARDDASAVRSQALRRANIDVMQDGAWERVPIDAQSVEAPLSRSAVFLVMAAGAGDAELARRPRRARRVGDLVKNVGFRDLGGRLSCIVGIGSALWDRLSPGRRPADLRPFAPIQGPVHAAPSTPGDLLFHLRAEREDMTFELERQLLDLIGDAAAVVDETTGFRYFDARDLLGFVDGTANPTGAELPDAALIGDDADPDFAGGSYVVVQKYLHDMAGWAALSTEEQEAIIGRTKIDNIELDDDDAPRKSHKSLATIEDDAGGELAILRDNMPFGRPGPASSAPTSSATRAACG